MNTIDEPDASADPEPRAGPFYFCRVTATNSIGSASADSNTVPASGSGYLLNADTAYIIDQNNAYITSVLP
jgi:hypothetical protein